MSSHVKLEKQLKGVLSKTMLGNWSFHISTRSHLVLVQYYCSPRNLQNASWMSKFSSLELCLSMFAKKSVDGRSKHTGTSNK